MGSNNKINLRYENSKDNVKENLNQSSLTKIKQNFEINPVNKSTDNKLGLRFKSNKLESPATVINNSIKLKTKQGSLNQEVDFERILADNNIQTVSNFRCSLDSNRLKKYGYQGEDTQEECDPRLLDIINLNKKRKSEATSENNLDVSENLTENMIETVNKLSPREEKAIVKETLRKEYKCDNTQLTDSKSK